MEPRCIIFLKIQRNSLISFIEYSHTGNGILILNI